MSKYIPGNQKHLSLEDRKYMERSLNASCSFKDIARFLCKDPTTISKEVNGSSTLAQPQNPYKPQKCGIFLSNFLKLYVVWRCVLCYNEV